MLIPKHTGGDTHVIKIIAIKCYHVWFWSTYFEILNIFFLSYIHGITKLYRQTDRKKSVPPPQTSNNFLQRRLKFQLLYNTNK